MGFEGKVAVVTGGAQGIGRATVAALLAEGAKVFVWDSDAEALAESPGIPVLCDVGEPDAIESAAGRLDGRCDLLVNNAGIGHGASPFDLTVEDWDRVLAVSLRSVWLTARAVGRSMPPGSSIVNVASTRALMSEPETEAYSAAKGGVVALTHALAASLAPRGIRVNCVSPGWIDTTGHQKASADPPTKLNPAAHVQHWSGRIGLPEDVASAILYLASAGFVTGTNLVIDGGMTRKMMYVE